MSKDSKSLPSASTGTEIDAFLKKVAATPVVKPAGHRGRLMFAMDATASREPSWDRACQIQGEMFQATKGLGGLEIQLVFYRGFHDFHATGWLDNSDALVRRMTAVFCLGGQTQIGRVLRHAIKETKSKKMDALVFVGDCIEEDIDELCHLAGELGLLGVPAFLFHEGGEPIASRGFKQIAKLTGGAYCPFDSSSAKQLRDLLSAVAVFAAGGRRALEDFGKRMGGQVLQLTHQMHR